MQTCQTEVGDARATVLANKHIVGFEITMDQPILMGREQTVGGLSIKG